MDGGADDTTSSRCGSRAASTAIYSVAITEKAVYIGGHFAWNESPTAPDPWPGLDDVGYGTGQGLSGYGLGDAVVRRDHLGALDPADGKALEWNPGSNSFEGNKAMVATPRGLLTGGDATTQGGANVGRVAFFDFNQLPAASDTDTTITEPDRGSGRRGRRRRSPSTGTPRSTGSVNRVQVEVQTADSQYLQDNLTTWGTPSTPSTRPWRHRTRRVRRDLVAAADHRRQPRADGASRHVPSATTGAQDPTKATKKIETFGLDRPDADHQHHGAERQPHPDLDLVHGHRHAPPTTSASTRSALRSVTTRPTATSQTTAPASTTTTRSGSTPDVVGATSTTWSYEVTVPYEGSGGCRRVARRHGRPVRPWTPPTATWIVSATASPRP